MSTTMKDVKPPFTPYDILAYLIPSLTCVGSIAYYEFCFNIHVKHQYTLYTLLQHVEEFIKSLNYIEVLNNNEKALSEGWGVQFLTLLGVIATLYVIGHIIASLSELVLDRFLVHKALGYPREKLLNLYDKPETSSSRLYYKGTFFWCNFAALTCYLMNLLPEHYACLHVLIWVVAIGIIIAFLLRILVASTPIRCLSVFLFGRKPWDVLESLVLKLMGGYAWPLNRIIRVYANLVQPQRGFDKNFQLLFSSKYKEVFGMDAETAHSNAYWMPYIYIANNSEMSYKILLNWLNLYGFLRNLSMAFYIAFIYTTISFFLEGHKLNPTESYCVSYLPAVLFVLAMISLLRFYYLYAAYYTKFLYRAFVYHTTTNCQNNQSTNKPQPETDNTENPDEESNDPT